MTAFAADNDVLFADPHLAMDALWFAQGQSEGHPVRVMRRTPDFETGFGETRIVSGAGLFEVRVSEVPNPARGDRIEVGGETFIVTGAPKRDELGLNWAIEARPQ
jgi:hypothetical protein